MVNGCRRLPIAGVGGRNFSQMAGMRPDNSLTHRITDTATLSGPCSIEIPGFGSGNPLILLSLQAQENCVMRSFAFL
jgi:hypothetical protein